MKMGLNNCVNHTNLDLSRFFFSKDWTNQSKENRFKKNSKFWFCYQLTASDDVLDIRRMWCTSS